MLWYRVGRAIATKWNLEIFMTFTSFPPLRNPILSTTIERLAWTLWIFKTVDTVSTFPG
jgi:hypothetical protein